MVSIENKFFGDYNPYQDLIHGDWFISKGKKHHTGEVYLNEKSMYEVDSLDKVLKPEKSKETLDPEGSLFTWYCESNSRKTTIWANFHGKNPNDEQVEINVRKSCFFPDRTGVNYIAVKGFRMCHAATQWAPPTAEQTGLIGPNWSKGWIIEDNIISDSKCSGISLGKERSTGENFCEIKKMKSGYQYQLECVFSALQIGWNKDNIGSHVVRNNVIFNCEQAGIVGHMGCAFSEIIGNHIYNIWIKRQFSGFEIAGIKLHASIDVKIKGNCINDCGLAIWLDWQAQGTRITGNLMYGNNSDMLIEVCHGPYVLDNNFLLSPASLTIWAQGGAFIHNLIAGTIRHKNEMRRATPYHYPHSTAVMGVGLILGGDDRFFNNIFAAPKLDPSFCEGEKSEDSKNQAEASGATTEKSEKYGLKTYEGHCSSLEEYIEGLEKYPRRTDMIPFDAYQNVKQAVFSKSNLYYNAAQPFTSEKDHAYNPDFRHDLKIEKRDNKVFLHVNLDESFKKVKTIIVNSKILELTRMSDAAFENPDGTQISIDSDYFGKKRKKTPKVGPIESLKKGKNKIRIF